MVRGRVLIKAGLAFVILGLLVTMGAVRIYFGSVADKVPTEFLESTRSVVESVHASLRGSENANELYSILAPGVHIYYLDGPETDLPHHRLGTYRINLTCLPCRYHATIYPYRETRLEDVNCEIWIVHFAGQGRWYQRLPEFRYYYATVSQASSPWSSRRIIYQSEKVFERYDSTPALVFDEESPGVVSVQLPNGAVVRFSSTEHESEDGKQLQLDQCETTAGGGV